MGDGSGQRASIDGFGTQDRGLDAVRTAWQVNLIDPVWGRNTLLWDTLRQFSAG